MRLKFLAAALALAACAGPAFAQSQSTGARAGAANETSLARDGGQLNIASGTRLTAELQNALDVSRARVGDRVVLKTTEAIKSNGETVVKRGARLVGHVSDVQRRARGAAESSVTILFDRLESGSLTAPISVTIDSVTQAGARARAGDDDLGAGASGHGSARSSGNSSSSSGGLIGGVTGAVGNTVGGVTGAASDVVGSTTETVGSTTRSVGRTLGQIRVTQSSSASAEAGSTLSLTGGDLRLEKGATFRLIVNESAGFNEQ